MTEEHLTDDELESLGRAKVANETAESLLSPEEKQILNEFQEVTSQLEQEQGTRADVPEVDDWVVQEGLRRVSGSRKVLRKWGDILEKVRFAGSDE